MKLPVMLGSICGLFISGCAIHPLPEDVTRETTFDIVEKIRCEGREALDNISVRLLRTSADPATLAFADRVAARELTVNELLQRHSRRLILSPEVWELFTAYSTSAVTFDFKFTITEENNNQAAADFRWLGGSGLFSLNTNAGAKLERQGERRFLVSSSFYELHNLNASYCANIAARIGNIVYPITGKIGLEEVFETFVRLDSVIDVTPRADSKFTDTLTFTTTLTAGATPRIALDPISDRRFRIAGANLALTAMRQDEHQVALSLAKGARLKLVAMTAALVAARRNAKARSREVAEERRTLDLFIIPRNGTGRVIIER